MKITKPDVFDWLDESGRFAPGWDRATPLLVLSNAKGFHLDAKEAILASLMLVLSIMSLIVSVTLKEPATVSVLLLASLIFAFRYKRANLEKLDKIEASNNDRITLYNGVNDTLHESQLIGGQINIVFEVLKIRSYEISESSNVRNEVNSQDYFLYKDIAGLRQGFLNRLDDNIAESIVSLIHRGATQDLKSVLGMFK